jgi:hypothetical protein
MPQEELYSYMSLNREPRRRVAPLPVAPRGAHHCRRASLCRASLCSASLFAALPQTVLAARTVISWTTSLGSSGKAAARQVERRLDGTDCGRPRQTG